MEFDMSKIKAGYTLRRVAETYFLLDITQSGRPYKKPLQLNEVGADIWTFLQEGCSEDEVVKKLQEEYGVDAEMLRSDVEEFLQTLSNYVSKK